MIRMELTGAKMGLNGRLMAENSKTCRQGELVPMKQEKPVGLWLKSRKEVEKSKQLEQIN